MMNKALTDVEVNRSKVMAEIIVEYSTAILFQNQEIIKLREVNANLQSIIDKLGKCDADKPVTSGG
jgi:hypothetical protein